MRIAERQWLIAQLFGEITNGAEVLTVYHSQIITCIFIQYSYRHSESISGTFKNLKMSLQQFHPASRRWFENRFGQATEAQLQAWPAIKGGRHVLIAAPTGSGKTLAAFYAAIDNLLQSAVNRQLSDGVQIVYVSPLKALGNDIHRNLEEPLDGIAEEMHMQGLAPVEITAAVRTGDTSQSERQKMAKKPPHILVTTPESLYLLLTSRSGRAMLSTAKTIITDEIHAMLGDKRGSHLALSIERLQHLVLQHSGQQLQRIGLSATQKPIEMVARYLVGDKDAELVQPSKLGTESKEITNSKTCVIVDAGHRRHLDLHLEVPGSPLSAIMSNEVWDELYERLVQLVSEHETTLVFVNTRRLSERLALALTERLGAGSVCSHHGSMSKELRHDAEQQLKAGNLKVLVATASMELGIDIGSVDLVLQFSSPKSIATFLQRVGRSGHSIHGTPKGIIFPLTRDDLAECTALLHSIRQGELDRIVMPDKPMDILAQQIVAEVSCVGPNQAGQDSEIAGWDLNALYQLFASAYPYRELSKQEFDDTINMLAEGYSTRRGRRGSYLHLDAINKQVRTRRGANLVALTNGGAIPDMFDYQVVLDPEDVVVGSLNEDFALEALPGDVFTLGTHSWQMLRVDGLKVRVRDAQGMQPTIPFWFGEGPGRTTELSQSVSRLRELISEKLIETSVADTVTWLETETGVPNSAAVQLVAYLHAGMKALGVMPTRSDLVMERFFDEVGDMHVVIHSPFGSRINRGWGLALRKRFCRSFNFELQAAANEDSIVISLGSVHSFPLDEVFRYLQTATLKETLIQALLDAPMFEVRWRWNATRSLAIQRNRSGKRVPPQFQRMDAEDLVAHVFPDQIACQENLTGKRDVPEHPLVVQTIHDCLTEAMDIEELTELIADIENTRLNMLAKDLREPSPFAQEIINARPYAFLDDAPFEERRTNAIRNRSWADPAETENYSLLDKDAIQRVRDEAWPIVTNPDELHDALLSLGYMTANEFEENGFSTKAKLLREMGRAAPLLFNGNTLWCATERLPLFMALEPNLRIPIPVPDFLYGQDWSAEDALRELLRGRLEGLGPMRATTFATETGLSTNNINAALLALEVEGYAFQGYFSAAKPIATANANENNAIEWCERRLLQRIHRYTIDTHRKAIKPVSLQCFTCFLFERHQIQPLQPVPEQHANRALQPSLDGQTQLQAALQLLDGIAAPAAAWEGDILPARIANYDPSWLDTLCISGRTVWGKYRPNSSQTRSGPIKTTSITLATRSNLELWQGLLAEHTEAEPVTLSATDLKTDQGQANDAEQGQIMSSKAERILQSLQQHGASFFDELQTRTGLLNSQLEEGLGELVSAGLLTSDSFTGLRALLTPSERKSHSARRRGRKAMFGVEDAGRWSLLKFQSLHPSKPAENDTSGKLLHNASSAAPHNNRRIARSLWDKLDEEQLERLVSIYLQRWGVIIRSVLERESSAPPWRILLTTLRKLELRGTIRGGRFVAGVGGEQFAYPETVEALRKVAKGLGQSSSATSSQNKSIQNTASNAATALETDSNYVCLTAVDPLNLLHLASFGKKLPRQQGNRILYESGVPIAVLDSGEMRLLKEIAAEQEWEIQQMLLRREFPARLRSYLGRSTSH